MKGRHVGEYTTTNKNGDSQVCNVYKVTGTADELASVQDSTSATKIADEDSKNGVKIGDTLVWLDYAGTNVELVITKDNRVAVDSSEERHMIAMCKRLGAQGVSILADYIAKKIKTGSASENTVTKSVESKDPIDSLDLD